MKSIYGGRFQTEKWMMEEPKRDNQDFREFMKELSAMQQKADHAELTEKVAIEEMRRHAL